MDNTVIDVIVDNLPNNPHCLHGPTLLFRRLRGKAKNYYACSACRDRKDCTFFINEVDLLKDSTCKQSNHWKMQQQLAVTALNKENRYKKYLEILELSKIKSSSITNLKKTEKSRKLTLNYCYSCCCLFTGIESQHEQCKILSDLTKQQLLQPTVIVIPKTDTKTHAQYFFSQTAVNDILLLLKRLGVTKLLCIGVPRIHECVTNSDNYKMQSLLLDLDKNYCNFYSKTNFIWFNMFNNHVFDAEQKHYLSNYLTSGKIAILLDPPFGGRVEPLAYTLKALSKNFNEENSQKGEFILDTFWFFPYFMEQHIVRSLPNFKMFDYKVNYENHSSFTNTGNKKRKFGSPVRIFTNVSLSQLDLSDVSGYKFCKFCSHWVSEENKHCHQCQACTSKDGRTYVHCSKCSKCVKPTYEHCDECNRCCLTNHICGQFQPDRNCYHCSQPGHKKNSCPELIRKREENFEDEIYGNTKSKMVPSKRRRKK